MTLTTPPNQPRDLEKSVMTFGTRDKRERPRKRPLPPETQMAKEKGRAMTKGKWREREGTRVDG